MANLALRFVGLRDSSQCQPALFAPITLFALIGLVFSSLAVAHASSPSADSVLFTTPNGESIGPLSFSPDGTLLAIGASKQISDGNWDGVTWLWDVASRKQVATLDKKFVWSLSFSPDGTLLAIGGGGVTWLWDVASRKQVTTLQHGDYDLALSFSPDGTLLANGGYGVTRLWDVASRKQVATFQLKDGYWVEGLSFSPDGTLLAIKGFKQEGGTDIAEVWLWDVASRKQVATLDRELKGGPLSFSPDGTLLATGDGEVTRLWDVASRKQVATFQPGDGYWVHSLSFSPDGPLLAIGGSGFKEEEGTNFGVVWLWDVASRKQVTTFQFGDGYRVHSLSFSPDGTLLATGGNKWISDGNWGGMMRLWDVSKWKPPHPSGLVKISGDNQQSMPSTALARPLVIEVRDQHGNPLPNARVTFSVTAGGGTLSSTTATTNANGRARSTLTLGSELGTNTVTATVSGLAAATFTATAVEQTPHSLTKVSGDGQGGRAGEPLAKPFIVSVLDQDRAAFAGAVVTFSVTAGGGTLSATTATTDANGRAATRLTLGSDLGTNTVTATVSGLAAVTFTATSITPHSLTKVSGDGQQGSVGERLSKPFVVSVLDQNGSAFAGAVVTFSVTGGGTLSATTDTTDANGRAATRLTLGSDEGTNTVTATVAGLDPVTFTATAITPHSLTKVSGDGQQGPVSTQLAKPFVVLVLDEEDAAMAGVVVTFSVTGGGGTMSSTTAITSPYGRAARTLTLGDEPGTNTVEVSVAGLDPVTFTATAIGEELSLDLSDLFNQSGKLVALPDHTQLLQNAPNPFNSQTVVSYFLLEPGPVRLEVFALSGQRIAVLHQGPQQAGYHRLHWDGRDAAGHSVASGTYLYRLVTDEVVLTRKLVLLR